MYPLIPSYSPDLNGQGKIFSHMLYLLVGLQHILPSIPYQIGIISEHGTRFLQKTVVVSDVVRKICISSNKNFHIDQQNL